jgi:hypothetical protein
MAEPRTVTLQGDQLLALEQTLTAVEELAARHQRMLLTMAHGGAPPSRLHLEAEAEQMGVLHHAVAIIRTTLAMGQRKVDS